MYIVDSKRKGIIKVRAEISETENKKAMENLNETKRRFFEKIKLTNI